MTYYQNFQGRRDNPCLFFQNQNGGNNEGENCQSTSNGNESDTEGVIVDVTVITHVNEFA